MKQKTIKMETIYFISAIALVILWGYAVVAKIYEHEKFIAQIKLSPILLIQQMGQPLSWILPIIESALIILLFTDRHRKLGLLLSFLLLVSFEIYISALIFSGLQLPCSCGGIISKLSWKQHLIFNAVFMCIAIAPMIYDRLDKEDPQEYSPRSI